MAAWKLVLLLGLGLISACSGLMCYTCTVTDCHDSPPEQCSLMRNLTLQNSNLTTLTQISVNAMPSCPLNDRELRWNPRLEHFMKTCSAEFQVCGTYFMRLGASMTRHYVNQSEFDILVPPKSFHASLIVMGCAKSPEAAQVEVTSTTKPEPTTPEPTTVEIHGIHHKAVGKLFAAMAHPDLVHETVEVPDSEVTILNSTTEKPTPVPKIQPRVEPKRTSEDALPLAEKRVQSFLKAGIKPKNPSTDESDPDFDPMAKRRKRDAPSISKKSKESVTGLEQVQVAPSQSETIFDSAEGAFEPENPSQIPPPPTSNDTEESPTSPSAIEIDSGEIFDLFEPNFTEDSNTTNSTEETSPSPTWLTSLMDNFWPGVIAEDEQDSNDSIEETTKTSTSTTPKTTNNDCPQIDTDDLTWVSWMWEQMFGTSDDIQHCLSCSQSFKVAENITEADGKRLNEVHQFVDFRHCSHCSQDFCNSHIPYELDTFRSEVEKDHKPPGGASAKGAEAPKEKGGAAGAASEVQVAVALVLSAIAALLAV